MNKYFILGFIALFSIFHTHQAFSQTDETNIAIQQAKLDAAIDALEKQQQAEKAKKEFQKQISQKKGATTEQRTYTTEQYSRDSVFNERLSLCLLSLITMFSLYFVITTISRNKHEAKDLILAAGLISIVYGTIILVLVVESLEQLTAAIGVLGAIAGYIFGSANSRTEPVAQVTPTPKKEKSTNT